MIEIYFKMDRLILFIRLLEIEVFYYSHVAVFIVPEDSM